MGETIKFSRLRRLSFCNSRELHDKKYILDGKVVLWVGIGFHDQSEEPDPEKHITVVEG